MKRFLKWSAKAIGIILLTILSVALVLYLYENIRTPGYRQLSTEESAAYIQVLEDQGQQPDQYVISKFQDHDVVIIGEGHGLKENYQFLISLLEPLSSNGINHIAMEFFLTADQPMVDTLLLSGTFDKELARKIIITEIANLAYHEFYQFFYKAWELNQAGADIRIINLYGNPYDRDRHMATLVDSIADLGEKVLVYCGNMHAITKFSQPLPNFVKYYYSIEDTRYRMGNFLLDEFEKDPFFISLHYTHWKRYWFVPFLYWKRNSLAFSGILDQVFRDYQQPVGFDSNLKLFRDISEDFSFTSVGKGKVDLSYYCDGYVYLRPVIDFHSARPLQGLASTPKEREYIHSRISEQSWHHFENEQTALEYYNSSGYPPEKASKQLDLRGLTDFSLN